MDVVRSEQGVLLVRGRLDSRSAPDVRQALHRLVDDGAGDALVDLAGLVLAEVSTLGLFLEAHRRAERSGRRLVLLDAPAPVGRVLRVTRLDRVLHLEASETLAAQTLVPRAASA